MNPMTLVNNMTVVQTSSFNRKVKKMHENAKKDLDQAVKEIVDKPLIGQIKKGILSNIYVYKFKMVGQLALLAYCISKKTDEIFLMDIGSHQNFYRDLENTIH